MRRDRYGGRGSDRWKGEGEMGRGNKGAERREGSRTRGKSRELRRKNRTGEDRREG